MQGNLYDWVLDYSVEINKALESKSKMLFIRIIILTMMVTNYDEHLFFAFIFVGQFTNNMDYREDQRKLELKYAAAFGPA